MFSELKIGDIVRWVPHKDWSCGGLGFVVDIGDMMWKIIWHSDLEDNISTKGMWYYEEDFVMRSGTIEIL